MKSRPAYLALVLSLALCLPFAAACSSSNKPDDSSSEKIEKEEDVVLSDDDTTETDLEELVDSQEDEEDEADDTEKESDDDADEQTQRIGEKGIGFVEIPANWVEFKDVDGNDSIQWCDGTPYTVISLNVFDLSSVPAEQRGSFTAEDAASSVWTNMINDGAVEDEIQGAHVTLAGRDAVQVYGVYPDGSFLVTWIVPDDEGEFRYVAAEGTSETIMDAVNYVQLTYSLD